MTDYLIPGIVMLLIGVVLLIIYMATMLFTGQTKSAGLFFTIPGAILVTLGLIAVIAPGLFISWISAVAGAFVALLSCIVTIYIYMRNVPPEPPTTTVAESLKGKTGTVIRDIKPESNTEGKVKIESTVWSATADIDIKIGTKVRVIDSEGVHVTVEPVDKIKENVSKDDGKKTDEKEDV